MSDVKSKTMDYLVYKPTISCPCPDRRAPACRTGRDRTRAGFFERPPAICRAGKLSPYRLLKQFL